ncbi:4Fe-4S binding protein [Moorella sulfitireducens]|uniref:4Fe-4S binding protein n=1 Tax=Neomoorella sulfitireducens TaxID=2972948 RepID=UPI0021AD1183|nr:4Fe-4S binding protein [Moorella sulfitireducens]
MSNKKTILSMTINILAILTLITALIANYLLPKDNLIPKLKEALPQAQSFNKITSNPTIYEGLNGQGEKIGYLVIDSAMGYGGPITVITSTDLEGNIVGAVIAEHKDTPTFIQIVMNHDFLKQFLGKKVNEPFALDKDIDRVTGATFSSKGITMAIAQGSHALAKNQFGFSITEEARPVNLGAKEITVISLLMLALAGVTFQLNKLRWLTLVGSLIFIGFKYNIALSIGNIASVLMGYFPPIKEYIFWYIWVLGVPFIIFMLGRNIYCSWLCPFGAAQEILAKIGGSNFRCHKSIDLKARKIKYVLTYIALLIAFVSSSPGQGSYEPFATLFARQGFGIQWFILPVVLFSSLLISRFWCHYFCPVGVINELICKLRRSLLGLLKRKKEKVVLKGEL